MEQNGFNTVNYLVGVDWYAPHEWMVMAQLLRKVFCDMKIK